MEPLSEVVILNAEWGRVFHEGRSGVEEVVLSPEQIAQWEGMRERHFDEECDLRRTFVRDAAPAAERTDA